MHQHQWGRRRSDRNTKNLLSPPRKAQLVVHQLRRGDLRAVLCAAWRNQTTGRRLEHWCCMIEAFLIRLENGQITKNLCSLCQLCARTHSLPDQTPISLPDDAGLVTFEDREPYRTPIRPGGTPPRPSSRRYRNPQHR